MNLKKAINEISFHDINKKKINFPKFFLKITIFATNLLCK